MARDDGQRRAPRPDADRRPGANQPSADPFDYESIFVPDPPAPPLRERLGSLPWRRALAALVAVVVLIVGINWGYRQFIPSGQQGPEVIVEVADGTGLNAVSAQLASGGVVPSALAFRLWDRVDRRDIAIVPGEYGFNSNSTVTQAMNVLANGPKQDTDRILIPEGYRLAQIAETVGTIRGLSAATFLELAESGTIRSRYQPVGENSLEGFLFPDTYLLSATETEESLLQQMVNQSDNVAGLAGLDNSLSKISQPPYQTMIIASMIEAEARTDEDRGKISRVIQNRLFDAMPLQIDATVLYGIGNTKQSLSNRDLQTDTPYNTYTNKGLPPTPICNPGRASIEAAMNPTPGTWLYYVLANADGSHAFADTYDQHLINVEAARAAGLL